MSQIYWFVDHSTFGVLFQTGGTDLHVKGDCCINICGSTCGTLTYLEQPQQRGFEMFDLCAL